MFFSIIVPVYNVEKYLNECIDSILSQSFTDFELILVDDGSNDLSGKICDDYAQKDNRITVIHKINGGLSDARNEGTKIAKGQYVVYIDSDDYISTCDFLKDLFEKSEDNPDIICYKFKKFFEDSKTFSTCAYAFPDIQKYQTLSQKINYLVENDAFYCSAWSKAVKLSLLKENTIEFEKGLLGEDQEWYYHVLLNATSIDGIDKDYIIYRQRANSITSSWKIKNLTDCIYIIDKWQKELQQSKKISLEYKEALLCSIAKLYCNLLIAYSSFDDKNKKVHFKKLKSLSFLLKYNLNPRVLYFNKLYKIVGFNLTMLILKIVCKVR